MVITSEPMAPPIARRRRDALPIESGRRGNIYFSGVGLKIDFSDNPKKPEVTGAGGYSLTGVTGETRSREIGNESRRAQFHDTMYRWNYLQKTADLDGLRADGKPNFLAIKAQKPQFGGSWFIWLYEFIGD